MERNKIAKLANKLIIELIKTDLPNKEINRLNDIVADIRDEAINYTCCCKSEQLKAFVDWWHGLSQEELVWYEGRYVEVFLSL